MVDEERLARLERLRALRELRERSAAPSRPSGPEGMMFGEQQPSALEAAISAILGGGRGLAEYATPERTGAAYEYAKTPEGREMIGETVGGIGGGALGALGGSFASPGAGTFAGGVAGGAAGSQLGGELAEYLGGTERSKEERIKRGLLEAAISAAIPGVGAAGKATYRGARKLTTAGAEDAARELIEGYATRNADELIGAIARAEGAETLTERGVAETTGDPGLAALEEALRRSGREDAQAFAARDLERMGAQTSLANELMPEATLSKAARGEAIRESMDDALQASKRKVSALYEAVDPEGTSIIDLKQANADVQSLAKKLSGKEVKGRELTPAVKELIDDFAATENVAKATGQPYANTWEQVQNLRSAATDLMQGATNRERKLLTQVVESLDNSVDEAMKTGGFTPEQVAIWNKGKALRAQQGQIFERGVVGRTLKKERGDYRIADERVVDALVDGKETTIKQALRAAKTTEAKDALKQSTAEAFRKAAIGTTGNPTPSGVKRFVTQNKEYIKELFGEQHYRNLRRLQDDLISDAQAKELRNLASKGQSSTAAAQQLNKILGKKAGDNSVYSALQTVALTAGGSSIGDTGGAITGFAAGKGLSKIGQYTGDKVADALVASMFDPIALKAMLRSGTERNTERFINKFLATALETEIGRQAAKPLAEVVTDE